jgi:hypothetical protein
MNFVHLVRGGLFHHQQTNPSATRTPSAPDQTEATKLQQVRMSGFGGFSHDDQDEEVKLSDDLKSRMLSMLQEYKTRRSREETEWNAIDDVDTQFDLALNKTLSAIHAYRALMTSQLIMRSDADKLAFLKFVGVEWQGQGHVRTVAVGLFLLNQTTTLSMKWLHERLERRPSALSKRS